ncbi:MAG: putative nucleotidyltransferase [Prokaryotic dsDNA virus sp.]|nr:MAG: putative nucleotidyltransferase [Prokaryotic dsDNA virus sp.]|tara:strand:- start:1725 stop:2093 length:369 start_codon:yes stop_codon:yes gene_type:complete
MKVVNKPWGSEIWWAHAEGKYMGKILNITKGNRLSLQYHDVKDETVYVLKGTLTLETASSPDTALLVGTESKTLHVGEVFRVLPKTVHRFCANISDVTLLEVSTDHPDDVVRVQDDYDREDK